MTAERTPPLRSADLTTLWVPAQPIVAAFISASVPNFHEANDLLQEVAQVAVERFADYDPSRPFVPWLLGIARNRLRKYYERQGRERRQFAPQTLDQIAAAHVRISPELEHRKEALAQCMERIAGRSRQVMEMRYLREMTPTAVARKMGMSLNAVFVMLHRVRQNLGQCIEQKLRAKGSADAHS